MKITLSKEEVQDFLIAQLRAKYAGIVPASHEVHIRLTYSDEAEIDVSPAEKAASEVEA